MKKKELDALVSKVNSIFKKKPGVMDRRTANLKIVKLLWQYIKDNPDQRFGQVLRNAGVVLDRQYFGEMEPRWVNHFNEESEQTLNRVSGRIKSYEKPD